MMNMPHAVPCTKKGHTNKLCWLSTLADNDGAEISRQDDILVCNECAAFKEITNRGFARRTADMALGSTIATLLRQVSDRNNSLDEARQQREKKVSQPAL